MISNNVVKELVAGVTIPESTGPIGMSSNSPSSDNLENVPWEEAWTNLFDNLYSTFQGCRLTLHSFSISLNV